MSAEELCISCRRPKASLKCELCQEPVCKDCEEFLTEGTFSFMPKVPDELTKTHYCRFCHEQHVEPALADYNEKMERAKEAYVFFTTQRKPVPVLKRSKESIRVDACDDRDETIMRLAYLAIDQGYNGLIETEVTSEKVRNAGYQKSRWRGEAIPAEIDVAKLERHLLSGWSD